MDTHIKLCVCVCNVNILLCIQLYPFVVLLAGVLIWYAFFSCLISPFISYSYYSARLIGILGFIRDYLSPIDLIRNYPHLVVLGTGLAFGFLVVRILVLKFVFVVSLTNRKENLKHFVIFQGRMILAHLCDEPKGLKTNMCMVMIC